jgi:glucose/arabinose dehydrogenase
MKIPLIVLALASGLAAALPKGALPLDAPDWPTDYRLHLAGASTVRMAGGLTLALAGAGPHDIAVEHPDGGAPVLRVWSAGELVRGPEEMTALAASGGEFPDAGLDFGKDFTAMVSFETPGGGTLISMSPAEGKWVSDAKALYLRDGRLVYDIGWLGELAGGQRLNNGKPQTVVLATRGGVAALWINGRKVAEKSGFTKPDVRGHRFHVGRATKDFGGEFKDGSIRGVRAWSRALADAEIATLFKDEGVGANTPDFTWQPETASRPVIEGGSGWVQALERSDHGQLVAQWNEESLAEGKTIYHQLCVVCHGDTENPGSLPTATRFGDGVFNNGADPYSMYLTLTHGYNQMVAQPQYTTAQKYAVIQFIREEFLKKHNPAAFTEITPAYLTSLPKGMSRAAAEVEDRSLPPHQRMDLGPALFWTYQVAPGNIAQKGIAVRLDEGPGGVSKGRAWMVYDHDTMRVAAATTDGFVDWKGIAFDGSHGTHTGLIGDRHVVNPDGPGWSLGGFEDTRAPAKDGRRYGPHDGLKFLGLYRHGVRVVIAAEIHGARVLESPAWLDYGSAPVFIRTIHLGESEKPLRLRVAPTDVNAVLRGAGSLAKEDGFWVATLPSGAACHLFVSRTDPASLDTLAQTFDEPLDLTPLTQGGPPKWPQTVTTTSVAGDESGAFVTDDFPLPLDNPWQSWLRPGGFDFTPDGKSAIVAMWNGDVWRVDGVAEKAPATLTWRRIASGLFQPLGVKFRGDELFVICRDQLARLHDLNDDGEIDFIECFNNDAQVTEHFHEFAMGLQVDDAGNFYYAKSGRHALDSVVPQHGTLLRVSADGSRTDILATGFRAANGVCINDDGTFFVTDQEGFWTPKNRINRVKPGGFYGNMYGYTDVTDTSDSAMEQPMVWITNAKDRSPAELLWVPENAWGDLGGSLLNLSYGTGRVFIVPHEEVHGQWQGAVCELPMPAFATGIMRGRFGVDGALYTCGMFAWAGNATAPGGFHRIRRGPAPARVPLEVRARKAGIEVTFSEPVELNAEYSLKVWSLKRTKSYGSGHFDERELKIQRVSISSSDPRTLAFDVPDLGPTDCYELKIGDRILHGTIHRTR